jgi:hypothetical protein
MAKLNWGVVVFVGSILAASEARVVCTMPAGTIEHNHIEFNAVCVNRPAYSFLIDAPTGSTGVGVAHNSIHAAGWTLDQSVVVA